MIIIREDCEKKNTKGSARSKRSVLLLALFLSLITMFVFGASAGADEPNVTVGPTIFSASEIDYPPFCIVDADGRAYGFSVELLRAALAAMERDVIFRLGPWAEVRGWLEKGEVQALPLVGRTPERESIFDFTFPYMSLHGAIVVRKDTKDILDLRDLSGRRVAVMKGDNAEEFLRREDRGIEIHTTATFEEALRELSEGRHDAVVIQRLVALRLIQETGLTNLLVINNPIEGFRQDFCFAVKEGDRDTLALLNEGLALVMADGTYRNLHAKWFAAMKLPSDRRILVGGDHNYPPYEYLDEKGGPAGFTVELTRAIAKEMGLDIEIRLGPWAEIVQDLEKGEIDVIQGMFYSLERDLKFDFTQPYMGNHYISVVRKGEGAPPAAVDELAGKRIVIQRGDVIHEFLVKNGFGDQVSVAETQEDVLSELAEGKHDCALAVRISAMYLIEKRGWTNLDLGRRPLFSTDYCYAVPQNHIALLTQFSEGLKILEETGEYRRLYEKWIGVYKDSPPSPAAILRYVAMVAIPMLLLLLTFFLWSSSLRKQVALRTEELRCSDEFQKAIIACSPVALYSIDPEGKILTWNASAEKIFGWATEEVIDKPLPIVPKDKHEEFAGLRKRVMEGRNFSGLEVVRQKKNGSLFDARVSLAPIHDAGGDMIGIMAAIEDITERKLAEEHIEHLNKVLRAIRDINQLIVRERDRDTLIRKCCRSLVDNRGYSAALIILTDENDRPVYCSEAGMKADFGPLNTLLEHSSLPPCCGLAQNAEEVVLIRRRDGVCNKCPIEAICAEECAMCVRLVHDGAILGYLAVVVAHGLIVDSEERSLFTELVEDLAYALHVLGMNKVRDESERERKSLEGQLLQAQKMESVGRLAGGVAHDFNNMLMVIIGNAELVLSRLDPSDSIYDNLQEILNSGMRSADLTRQLLAFARKQTISPIVLDVNEIVEVMLKMLRRLLGEDIDILWKPCVNLWSVKMDPAQIDQILANLCVNARDAVAGVGKVIIETGNITFDAEYCESHKGFVPGEFALLAVSDDGFGMDKETRDKVFEPFFTTKKEGHGTGLGLSTVYGIVKQNHGFINVYSEPGQGTTFKIYLPRHEGRAGDAQATTVNAAPKGSGETVLLVEDESTILKIGKGMLGKLGYTVLAVSKPGEAIRLAREHANEIQLLITDVIMPELNGRELAERIREINPNIKCLFMSGYTADIIAHHGVLEVGIQFIQKPLSLANMARKVREVLDS